MAEVGEAEVLEYLIYGEIMSVRKNEDMTRRGWRGAESTSALLGRGAHDWRTFMTSVKGQSSYQRSEV